MIFQNQQQQSTIYLQLQLLAQAQAQLQLQKQLQLQQALNQPCNNDSAPAIPSSSIESEAPSCCIQLSQLHETDVLLGKNGRFQKRAMNQLYVQMIRSNCLFYVFLPNDAKKDFATSVKNFFASVLGVRFLRQGTKKDTFGFLEDGSGDPKKDIVCVIGKALGDDSNRRRANPLSVVGKHDGCYIYCRPASNEFYRVTTEEDIQQILKSENGPKSLLIVPRSMQESPMLAAHINSLPRYEQHAGCEAEHNASAVSLPSTWATGKRVHSEVDVVPEEIYYSEENARAAKRRRSVEPIPVSYPAQEVAWMDASEQEQSMFIAEAEALLRDDCFMAEDDGASQGQVSLSESEREQYDPLYC